MLIKIGSSKYLDGGRIIGIFDMDTATVCAASRVFLSRAQKEGRVSLADEDIPCDDSNYKMNPPLRSKADVQALKDGLKNGIMDVISTDHAPHGAEEKSKSMAASPFGIVGVETAFALTVTELVEQGYLTKMQLVEKMSYNPACVLGIDKGQLAEGKAADIVIADFEESYTIDVSKFASKGKNTPFDGKQVKGRIYKTLVDGNVVYDYEKEA